MEESSTQKLNIIENVFDPINKITKVHNDKDLLLISKEALVSYTREEIEKLEVLTKRYTTDTLKLLDYSKQLQECNSAINISRKSLDLKSDTIVSLKQKCHQIQSKFTNRMNEYETTYNGFLQKYNETRLFYEINHPLYKRIKEHKIKYMKMEITCKMMKHKYKQEIDRSKILQDIQNKLFNATIVDFVKCVFDNWKVQKLVEELCVVKTKKNDVAEQLKALEVRAEETKKEHEKIKSPSAQNAITTSKLPAYPPNKAATDYGFSVDTVKNTTIGKSKEHNQLFMTKIQEQCEQRQQQWNPQASFCSIYGSSTTIQKSPSASLQGIKRTLIEPDSAVFKVPKTDLNNAYSYSMIHNSNTKFKSSLNSSLRASLEMQSFQLRHHLYRGNDTKSYSLSNKTQKNSGLSFLPNSASFSSFGSGVDNLRNQISKPLQRITETPSTEVSHSNFEVPVSVSNNPILSEVNINTPSFDNTQAQSKLKEDMIIDNPTNTSQISIATQPNTTTVENHKQAQSSKLSSQSNKNLPTIELPLVSSQGYPQSSTVQNHIQQIDSVGYIHLSESKNNYQSHSLTIPVPLVAESQLTSSQNFVQSTTVPKHMKKMFSSPIMQHRLSQGVNQKLTLSQDLPSQTTASLMPNINLSPALQNEIHQEATPLQKDLPSSVPPESTQIAENISGCSSTFSQKCNGLTQILANINKIVIPDTQQTDTNETQQAPATTTTSSTVFSHFFLKPQDGESTKEPSIESVPQANEGAKQIQQKNIYRRQVLAPDILNNQQAEPDMSYVEQEDAPQWLLSPMEQSVCEPTSDGITSAQTDTFNFNFGQAPTASNTNSMFGGGGSIFNFFSTS